MPDVDLRRQVFPYTHLLYIFILHSCTSQLPYLHHTTPTTPLMLYTRLQMTLIKLKRRILQHHPRRPRQRLTPCSSHMLLLWLRLLIHLHLPFPTTRAGRNIAWCAAFTVLPCALAAEAFTSWPTVGVCAWVVCPPAAFACFVRCVIRWSVDAHETFPANEIGQICVT